MNYLVDLFQAVVQPVFSSCGDIDYVYPVNGSLRIKVTQLVSIYSNWVWIG